MSAENPIDSLPQGWKEAVLGDVCKVVSGSTPKTNISEYWGGDIPWLTPNDLSKNRSKVVHGGERNLTQRGFDSCSTQMVPEGAVLFTSRAPIGYVAIAGAPMCTNQGFKSAIPGDEIVSEFIYWQLQNLTEDIRSRASGTTFLEISGKGFAATKILVPSLAEQNKIVEILEEQLSRLDAALASVRAVREKSARFRRSLLHAAFTGTLTGHDAEAGTLPIGWSTIRLGDCLEKLKSGKLVERGWSPQCLSQPSPDEDTWGVLKTTAVQMGDYWADFNKELPKALEPKIGLEINDGDFLMTTTGPRNRCGIVCLVNQTRKKLIFSGKILRFRADASKLIPGWLMYSMMSPDIQKTFDEMKVGTSDSSVSIGNQQVLDLIIPVAPLDEQQKTLELLEAQFSRLDASLAIADAIERKASALRRSLLHAAFSGNLTKEWREAAHV